MRLYEYLDSTKGDMLVCGCGCGYGSRPQHWPQTTLLVAIHREIRTQFGPTYAVSAARCPRHNAAIAQSERSQHAVACAVDLAYPAGCDRAKFRKAAEAIVARLTNGQGGVGFYDWGIHYDAGNGETPGRRWNFPSTDTK